MLILYEQWAGERLCLESAIPRYRRVGRPISVSAVPFGPGIDIWRSCRFLGAIFRAFRMLPGGLGRFLPGDIGANHGRLRHIGWEKCCHGFTSRPQETSVWFWMSFSFFSGILLPLVLICLQGPFLLGITLKVLLVGSLLGACLRVAVLLVFLPLEKWFGVVLVLCLLRWVAGVCLARGSGGGVKRVRLYRRTPAHFARQGISGVQVRPRVWKRLRDPLGSDSGLPGAKFLRVHQETGGHDPGFARVGIG